MLKMYIEKICYAYKKKIIFKENVIPTEMYIGN